jgi:KAP family P-loop domain
MTTTETVTAGERVDSLQHLIAEYGHATSPQIKNFSGLAAAAQVARYQSKASDTKRVTRSTGLWTLMRLDNDIRRALEKSGVEEDALRDVLSLRDDPPPVDVADVELHDDFARALRRYLANLPDTRPIELADLAVAILTAGRDESAGLLPERLHKLGVEYTRAIPRLEALIADTPATEKKPPAEEFSGSVRRVRAQLGADTRVTSTQIAERLQVIHPEYGGDMFGHIKLSSGTGQTATTDDWLARVRRLYDMAELARSRHHVIDGELTLLALAELDTSLRESLRANGFLDTLARDVEVKPRRATADRTEWAPDAPADTDLLGRKRLAQALVQRVHQLTAPGSRSKRSFLIHVDGPWGAGKSTLFGFLREELAHDFLIVTINAWREQRIGVAWWTMLSSLRREVRSSTPWYRRPISWGADLADRVRARWVPFLAVVVVLSGVVIGFISAAGLSLKAGADVADSLLKIVSITSAAFAGLVAAVRFLLPGSKRSAQGFVESNDNPMHEVGRLFARTLKRAKRPAVFLVDDLDRCDEGYVVEFLETVQTLVRDAPDFLSQRERPSELAGPYAFIAADGRWIRSSYEHHYDTFKQTAAPGRPLGYLFLEKIFQLHLRLPGITESAREAFLATLLMPSRQRESRSGTEHEVVRAATAAVNEATSENDVIQAARHAQKITDPVTRMKLLGDAAVKFSAPTIVDATEHELARFGTYLEPNPRSMKLFVNTYGVLRSLRTLEEEFVASGPLALWTVVEIRWPQLADLLRDDPEAIQRGESDGNEPEIANLLRIPEVACVLGDTTDGPMTPQLIRQCSGAT